MLHIDTDTRGDTHKNGNELQPIHPALKEFLQGFSTRSLIFLVLVFLGSYMTIPGYMSQLEIYYKSHIRFRI